MRTVSKSRALAAALAAVGLLASVGDLAGCSANGNVVAPPEPPASPDDALDDAAPPLETDGGVAEASSCDDCMFFLPTCEAQTFCPVDLNDLGLNPKAALLDIDGTSNSDIWIAGTKGTLLHHDGSAWSKVRAPDVSLTQIVSRTVSDVWTASTLSLFYVRESGSDDAWPRARLVPLVVDAHINGMWSGAGATWTWLALKSTPFEAFEGRVEKSRNVKRVRKSTTAYRYDEPFSCGGICPVPLRQAFMDVHGSSKDDAWAVGELGAAYRVSEADSDRPTLTPFDSRTYATLHGVWSSEANDAWAVGGGGTLRHYSGSSDHRFEVVESPVTSTLRSVWGASKTDVWAVGDRGVVLHYDGTAWSRVPLGGVSNRPDLHAVWGATPTDVWVAGQSVLLRLSLGGGT